LSVSVPGDVGIKDPQGGSGLYWAPIVG